MCYRGQAGTLTNAVITFCCPILTTKSFYEVFHILFLEARRAFEPPFYTAGTWCSERLTDLPQVTQLVSGRTRTRLQTPFPYTDCIYPITSWLTTSAISQMLDRRTKPVVQTHWLSNFMGQLCITGFEQRLKRPLMLCSLVLSLIHFLHTWTSEDYCTSSATQLEQEGCFMPHENRKGGVRRHRSLSVGQAPYRGHLLTAFHLHSRRLSLRRFHSILCLQPGNEIIRSGMAAPPAMSDR